ncbi:PREDICTED: apoptosis regulatory protein Siva isoform X2 [Crocodylus porosus]|uniref:apoptosis regulatory protein Siva isoform X2 n=1 Tax=Crocodylus porosus TaxID=8502 RepID=UPI00093A39A7|nr:PREDICTED: apoptosis regulatory protein Siva isoform X2 [Crocodylus porosus]
MRHRSNSLACTGSPFAAHCGCPKLQATTRCIMSPCALGMKQGPEERKAWRYLLLQLKHQRAEQPAPPMGVSKACSSCVRTVDIKEVCTQCDRLICQHCRKLCSCCNAVICSMCCTIDYSDVGEQVLCSGCSMFEV